MDIDDETNSSNQFNAELSTEEKKEIAEAFKHAQEKFVELSTWIKNFHMKFPRCKSFVMASESDAEPASAIIQSTVVEKTPQNANDDYEHSSKKHISVDNEGGRTVLWHFLLVAEHYVF